MGLAITAYRNLTLAQTEPDDEDLEDGTMAVYANANSPGREAPFVDRAVYSFSESSECLRMSYGGYSVWREALARLAGYAPDERAPEFPASAGCFAADAGPFYELINFSDCEGVIGADACRKLLADFDAWDERAREPSEPLWFYSAYTKLHAGLRLAADGGCLDFH